MQFLFLMLIWFYMRLHDTTLLVSMLTFLIKHGQDSIWPLPLSDHPIPFLTKCLNSTHLILNYKGPVVISSLLFLIGNVWLVLVDLFHCPPYDSFHVFSEERCRVRTRTTSAYEYLCDFGYFKVYSLYRPGTHLLWVFTIRWLDITINIKKLFTITLKSAIMQ